MNIEDVQDLEVSLSSNTPPINTELSNIGLQGYSAYEVAVQNGYTGTETQWLASLKGEPGTTDYNNLTNKPTIPSKTSQLTNDSNYLTQHQSIKTINNETIVGEGNITIEGGSGGNIHVGTDTPTDDSEVWINPEGTPDTIPTKTSQLTNDSGFITNTSYATSSTGGVIKGGSNSFQITSSGIPQVITQTYEVYTGSMTNGSFIGKGTLENVLSAKGYLTLDTLPKYNGEVE